MSVLYIYLKDIVVNVFFTQVHRLVVVNDEDRVEGVVSLSDILAYLVLRPLGIQNFIFLV